MKKAYFCAAILLAGASGSQAATPVANATHPTQKLCKIKGTWQVSSGANFLGTYVMRSDTAGTFTFADCPDNITYRVTVNREDATGFEVTGIGKKSQYCDRYFTDTQTFDPGSCTVTSGTLDQVHPNYGSLSDSWMKSTAAKAKPPAGLTRNLK